MTSTARRYQSNTSFQKIPLEQLYQQTAEQLDLPVSLVKEVVLQQYEAYATFLNLNITSKVEIYGICRFEARLRPFYSTFRSYLHLYRKHRTQHYLDILRFLISHRFVAHKFAHYYLKPYKRWQIPSSLLRKTNYNSSN